MVKFFKNKKSIGQLLRLFFVFLDQKGTMGKVKRSRQKLHISTSTAKDQSKDKNQPEREVQLEDDKDTKSEKVKWRAVFFGYQSKLFWCKQWIIKQMFYTSVKISIGVTILRYMGVTFIYSNTRIASHQKQV